MRLYAMGFAVRLKPRQKPKPSATVIAVSIEKPLSAAALKGLLCNL